jgi:hypothetical protein
VAIHDLIQYRRNRALRVRYLDRLQFETVAVGSKSVAVSGLRQSSGRTVEVGHAGRSSYSRGNPRCRSDLETDDQQLDFGVAENEQQQQNETGKRNDLAVRN